MTLSDLWPRFQGHGITEGEYLKNGACWGQSFYRTLIGNHTGVNASRGFVSISWASCSCLSRSESGAPCVQWVHSSNKHCDGFYRPIPTSFAAFYSQEIALSAVLIVLTFVARWRHNFREIVVKNCEKSKNWRKRLCAPLRIDGNVL